MSHTKRFIIGSDPHARVSEKGSPQFIAEEGRCFVWGVDEGKKVFLRPVSVDLFDIDGTVMELLHDPAQRRIDASFLAGVTIKNEFYPGTAVAVTGRDYSQVVEVMGGVKPFFPVISSNGADLFLSNGIRRSYPFTPQERVFIDKMKAAMREFGDRHPYLVTEVKDWSVGYHTASRQGYGDQHGISGEVLADMVTKASQTIYTLLAEAVEEADKKGLSFILGGAEATNRELHHGKINKADAIPLFASYLATLPSGSNWSYVNFFGDSMRGHGNDREMAKKTRQNGGSVIMVTNGLSERIPDVGSDSEPHFGFATPKELGEFYYFRVCQSVVRDFGRAALMRSLEKHKIKLVL